MHYAYIVTRIMDSRDSNVYYMNVYIGILRIKTFYIMSKNTTLIAVNCNL